jgi:hypothetical protein
VFLCPFVRFSYWILELFRYVWYFMFFILLSMQCLRDRPFNLKRGGGCYGFLFRSEFFFRTTQELEYLFFLLYDKNSESDYFFFLHQNQNIFFSNIGNQNIFLEKKHKPPPFKVKWSFPKLNEKIIWNHCLNNVFWELQILDNWWKFTLCCN